jgi:K+-sensing histidine kinase KdpD
MNDIVTPPAARVLALLDDAASGAALLELASPLARALRRELSVVYVESTRSVVAAALPFAQVLPPGGGRWMPLHEGDVELGFRAQVARLRQLTARVALRDALQWSLRVMRGEIAEAAGRLQSESDLLLLAGSTALAARAASALPRARRCPTVAALGDGDAASQRAWRVATQLAGAMAGALRPAHLDPGAKPLDQPQWLRELARCDVLVLPRSAVDLGAVLLLRCPVLLVG